MVTGKREKDITPGKIRSIPCDVCGGERFTPILNKASSRGEIYQVVRCKKCGLVQVNPQPDVQAVKPYYEAGYFQNRTDRGYNNYFSEKLKKQINQVYNMNLEDLGFDEIEVALGVRKKLVRWKPKALDVGCAAGYFVEHMRKRGWDSMGVEISEDAASFGIEELGLNILIDDFLSCKDLKGESFDMITFWASLEHMHSPMTVLRRCYELLKPGGRLVLSTCRYGLIARYRGEDWRYMNVPEHLYFFSLRGLKKAASSEGFKLFRSVTYGSGFTTKEDAGPLYKYMKRIMDPLVKFTGQGDMMALHFIKPDDSGEKKKSTHH